MTPPVEAQAPQDKTTPEVPKQVEVATVQKDNKSKRKRQWNRGSRGQPNSNSAISGHPQAKQARFTEYGSSEPVTNTFIHPAGFMIPKVPHFTMQISLTGLDRISQQCYLVFQNREANQAFGAMSMHQFQHICNYAALIRVYYVMFKTHTYHGFEIPGLEMQHSALLTLPLPSAICEYIETIGVVKTPNHMNVVPYVGPLQQHLRSRYNPLFVLDNQGNRTDVPCNPNNLEQYPLHSYAAGISRPSSMMDPMFRTIVCDDYNGKESILVSYEQVGKDSVPYSFAPLTEYVARKGAALRYWDQELRHIGDFEYFSNSFRGSNFEDQPYIGFMVHSSTKKA